MPRPTSAPAATTRAPRRIQSTDVLRRSARRNSSGTRIVGRKNASRGPWKTAVRRGRASPMPGGFASSTTVVSTRFGRASVPTSTTAYSAAGYPSFPAAASALARARVLRTAPAAAGASSGRVFRKATTRERFASIRTFHSSFCSGRKKRTTQYARGSWRSERRRNASGPPFSMTYRAASSENCGMPPSSCGCAARTASSSANPVPWYVTDRQSDGSTPFTRRKRFAISSARDLPVSSSTSGGTCSPGRKSEEARMRASTPIPASALGESGRTGGMAAGAGSTRGGGGTNPMSPLERPASGRNPPRRRYSTSETAIGSSRMREAIAPETT